jgi:hypothetical protein
VPELPQPDINIRQQKQPKNMEHQADIGTEVFDRWATFYIFEHQGKKYACVWHVIAYAMMTEDEKTKEEHNKVKDVYAFDEKKTLKFLERARKDYNRKVKEYEQRCTQREAIEAKLSNRIKRVWQKLAKKEVEIREDQVRHSKMDEIVLRSTLYNGGQEVGGTFFGKATVVDKTSNSICLRLCRVTRYGRAGLQWFTQEDFNKRFKLMTDEQARTYHAKERWNGVEARQEDGEVL